MPRRAAAIVAALAAVVSLAGALWLACRPERVLDVVAWTGGARLVDEHHGIRQQRRNDCGPAALSHALGELGMDTEYPDPRGRLQPGPNGCKLEELAREAARRGAVPRMRRFRPNEIEEVRSPAVLHLRRGHYVVLEGRSASGALRLQDPALGLLEQSCAELSRSWSGWTLELSLPEGRVP